LRDAHLLKSLAPAARLFWFRVDLLSRRLCSLRYNSFPVE
jgi:hypothetical protein